MPLGPDDRVAWERDGWWCSRGAVSDDVVARLSSWVDEVAAWSVLDGLGIHHFEQTDAGPVIARSELFADAHAQLGEFVRGSMIGDVLTQLFGEPGVLFKEKVNYKQPGGGGFAPHQDATAYRFVDHHISVMVPLDASTEASGCLYFAPGHRDGQLPTDDRGRITEPAAAQLEWRPVEAGPGDLLFFDSYAPHHSSTNTTNSPRRALYLTYNAASRGDFRATYYADKQAEFDAAGTTFGGERVRISINDDFLGRPVEPTVRNHRMDPVMSGPRDDWTS